MKTPGIVRVTMLCVIYQNVFINNYFSITRHFHLTYAGIKLHKIIIDSYDPSLTFLVNDMQGLQQWLVIIGRGQICSAASLLIKTR